MSRSKKDILDTESMLHRLGELLAQHASGEATMQCRTDAESLRHISMTLRRWHELECGDSNDHGSWAIVRGRRMAPGVVEGSRGTFEYADDGSPYLERHSHSTNGATYHRLDDKETGARRRLAKILARYPTLTAYVQGDPRGCALYILKPGDVPPGADVSSYYSRGLAVYQ